MTEYKLVREQEWSQAVSLADRVFRDDEQKSMAEGFPLVFSPALRQSYGAFEEGRLVAFIGLVPHLIRIGTAILKTFSIGAVCTDPDERGRGHAGRILELVQQHAADAGASLLLVSGARPLYTRAHCYPYGEMHRYGLTPDGVGTVRKLREGITVRGMDPRICMPFTIWPARRFAFEQSPYEFALLLRAEAYASCTKLAHRTLLAEENGKLLAFAVMSLPIPGITPQRAPFLVEWAGDPSVAAGLLIHAVQAYGLEKLEAVAPWHEQEFIEAMDGISYQIEQNYGTIHVLSPDHLLEQLRPYWQDQGLSDTNFQVRQEADGTYLLALAGKSHTLTTEEWVSLLFDPVSKADLPAEWKKPLAACFPIPFPYVAGLNYV
ncbi:GNAT family N-acetyltransferase [Paenibacillus larvae]